MAATPEEQAWQQVYRLLESAEDALGSLQADRLHSDAQAAGDDILLELAERLQALATDLELHCEELNRRADELLPAALNARQRELDRQRRAFERSQ